MNEHSHVFQLKISLKGIHPPIWRRILVSSIMTLADLNRVIQKTMGWTDSSIHQFRFGDMSFGMFYPEHNHDIRDDQYVRIGQLINQVNDRMIYEYKFRDGWEHEIKLEKILTLDEGHQLPVCVSGKRACPPEDCGGIEGYYHLLDVLDDPEDPEYKDIMDLLGVLFDPDRIDLQEINENLMKMY